MRFAAYNAPTYKYVKFRDIKLHHQNKHYKGSIVVSNWNFNKVTYERFALQCICKQLEEVGSRSLVRSARATNDVPRIVYGIVCV